MPLQATCARSERELLRSMSSLQCGNEETARASKTARALFDESSFDALPDAVALKILLLAPIDVRLRIGALLQRRCARLLREPDAWRVIDFRGCDAPVSDRALLLLCARAGAALRCLDLSGCDVNRARLTTSGVIGSLRGSAGLNLECLYTRCAADDDRFLCRFDHEHATALREACPRLQDGTFVLHVNNARVLETVIASALHALPGEVDLDVSNSVQVSYTKLLVNLIAREDTRGAGSALVGLKLRDATMDEDVVDALKELMMCAKLRKLSLHVASGGDDRGMCAVLARAIRRSRLPSLSLVVDDLGDEAQALATLLSDANCPLTHLRLRGRYHSGPSHALQLAAAITANTSLTDVQLTDITLDDEDVSALARACVSNSTLRTVRCLGGRIGKPLREMITMFMAHKTPRSVKWSWAFQLDFCLYQDDAAVSSEAARLHNSACT